MWEHSLAARETSDIVRSVLRRLRRGRDAASASPGELTEAWSNTFRRVNDFMAFLWASSKAKTAHGAQAATRQPRSSTEPSLISSARHLRALRQMRRALAATSESARPKRHDKTLLSLR